MQTKIVIGIVVVLVVIAALFAWKTYSGTPQAPTQTVTPNTLQTYASSALGFSLRYPEGYTVDESYAYDQFGEKKLIHGVKFTIPRAMATGTNLASDTYLSVETLPRAQHCTADIYLPGNVIATQLMEGTTTYSVATSTGAAAGNRYEETVYARTGAKPCIAVRYFVHYGAMQNYPEGAVRAFDHAALLSEFDSIRRSLMLNQ